MRISDEKEAELRTKYKIPAWYDHGLELSDGRICFSLMDSDITIYPDGSCFENHMGLNSNASGHAFIDSRWPPLDNGS